MKHAYDQKMWAFVSDYIRIKKLYDEGGIYLDTDMMVVKPITDLLDLECFIGGEKTIVVGSVMGSISNNIFFKNCLKQYDNFELNKNFDWGIVQMPKVLTKELQKISKTPLNFKKGKNKIQNITVFSYEYFFPFPFLKKNELHNYKKFILPETIAVHLWSGSWLPANKSEFFYIRNKQYLKGLNIVMKTIITDKPKDYQYFKKVILCVKESIM